jgi:hypothetical protein
VVLHRPHRDATHTIGTILGTPLNPHKPLAVDGPAWETQVAVARVRIAGAVPDPDEPGLDDRQALE